MVAAADLRECRRIIRRHARSFSFAARFLPRDVRDDVAVVYAYYRTVDDLVDETSAGLTRAEVETHLDGWDRWLAAGTPASDLDAVHRALPAVVERRGLDTEELRVVIRGQRSDLVHRRPATLAELEAYAYDVAGSVGVVMARLLGAEDPRARRHAADLGTAMQLTNICRDVDEDLARGRVYLPVDICAAAHCDDRALSDRSASPEVRAAVRTLAHRARYLYAQGLAGLDLLPPSTRFPIAVAARAYGGILDRLAQRDYDVFSGRVGLRSRHRWALAARLYAHRARGRRAA
ncbi:MAG: phytoene/squalene synthase family protein [Candidatus Dormibacteria bacterium]